MSGKCRPCLRKKTLENVFHCNLSKTDKECIYAVFDLVDSQKAEIERLNKANTSVVEHLKKSRRQLKTAKSEAIKEFAERLKEKAETETYIDYLPNGNSYEYEYKTVDVDDINNLVKEMVGDEDG